MPNKIFEVSGLDYIGKSTQAELFTFETQDKVVKNLGSWTGYAPNKIPEHLPPRDFFNWWFGGSSEEEICAALCSAYRERAARSTGLGALDLVVVERGRTMLQAQLAANFATRADTSPDQYYDYVLHEVKRYVGPPRPDHREVLLLPDDNWLKQVAGFRDYVRTPKTGGSGFTDEQNNFYSQYMRNTASALVELGDIQNIETISVDEPAVDINNQLRRHSLLADVALPGLLSQEPIVLGLGGLSESGKSAVADMLAAEDGFTRIKLGFFNERSRQADERYGDPRQIALSAVHFLAANRHIKQMTLESLHGPEFAAEMKLLIGNRWRTVFISLSDAVRTERVKRQHPGENIAKLLSEQRKKDKIKINKGVLRYAEFADIIVDNSGQLKETVDQIRRGIVLLNSDRVSLRMNKQEDWNITKPPDIVNKLTSLCSLEPEPGYRPNRCRAVIFSTDGKSVLGIARNRPDREPYAVYPGGGLEDYDIDAISGVRRELTEELALSHNDYILTGQAIEHEGELFYIGYARYQFDVDTIGGPESERDSASAGEYRPGWFPVDSLSESRMFPEEISRLVEEAAKPSNPTT